MIGMKLKQKLVELKQKPHKRSKLDKVGFPCAFALCAALSLWLYFSHPSTASPSLVAHALGFALIFSFISVVFVCYEIIEPYRARENEKSPPSDEEKRATKLLSWSVIWLAVVSVLLYLISLVPVEWCVPYLVGCYAMAAFGLLGAFLSIKELMKHGRPSQIDAITGFVDLGMGCGVLVALQMMFPQGLLSLDAADTCLLVLILAGWGFLWVLAGVVNILLNFTLMALENRQCGGGVNGLR